MTCEECYAQDCDCDGADERDDSYCEGGCGADLDEVGGSTWEVEPGRTVQLCQECSQAWYEHKEANR